ncbi:hypothetical protein OW763_13445 [Clostridium aestuarii]|uniref:Uncharacterized protein n=1 Tax=Clostridium aestuarii TaxID=338193 RepID=A0ABT4D2K0_9CLOT|nr:hypothetical protein [Clostridium aestuarii]MCY6485337.1 hypothetical protein [Clostridium aestuarii]
MAIDSITISIDNINKDILKYYCYNNKQHTNPLLNTFPFIDTKKLKYFTNKKNNYKDKFEGTFNGIHITYMPYLNRGYISIKFNIPKLLYGYNIYSVYQYNSRIIWKRLCYELRDVINLIKYPYIDFWRITEYENNIDIIDDININVARYNVIRKIYTQNIYMDSTYADNGTIYFYPSKSSKSNPSYKIVVYDKLKEFKDKATGINTSNVLNNKELIHLNSNQNILRIEIKNYRSKITKDFSYTKVLSSKSEAKTEYLASPMSSYIGSFAEGFNYQHQIGEIKYYLKRLHLDKIITKRYRLFEVIEKDNTLKASTKKKIKNLIRYLNGEVKKCSVSDKTAREYRDFILSKGYHYIYSDNQLDPITIDGIIKKLPETQINNINRYKDSNIFKNFFY